MLAILRFLTIGELSNSCAGSLEQGRPAPSWVGYCVACSFGMFAALTLFLCALHCTAEPSVRYGGASGGATTILCPNAHAVVGARIYEDANLIAGIALLCRAEGGSASAPLVETPLLGNATGRKTTLACPDEHAAVGIWGAADLLLDQFSLSCARASWPRSPVAHLPGVGGLGGHGFHARCAGRLRGLAGTAAPGVESVAMVCEDEDA